MSDYKTGQTPNQMHPQGGGDGCAPDGDPADQPKAPNGGCEVLPTAEPPKLGEPEKCPPPPCCCPKGPTTPSNCLEDLIKAQTKEITEAERAKSFKADLEALQEKTKAAEATYTGAEYARLLKEWKRLDGEIVGLIRKLVCNFPCWWCLIECHICPLLYEIGYREQKLFGGGKLYADVNSLYDQRYWHERNRDAKRGVFERVQKVLAAWEKPAETIAAALAANDTLIKAIDFVAADAAKVVYDVFFQLVPMHMAIAPPVDPAQPALTTTGIDKKYTQFCECDVGTPDDCCGPDVGASTLRHRLIGPQPYLVHPDQYFSIICCLTRERYLPAKDALAKAESDLEQIVGDIASYTTYINERMKSLGKDAKAALTKLPIQCDDYTSSQKPSQPPSQSAA